MLQSVQRSRRRRRRRRCRRLIKLAQDGKRQLLLRQEEEGFFKRFIFNLWGLSTNVHSDDFFIKMLRLNKRIL